MVPEKPATGILKLGEHDNSVSYQVACNCHDPEHNHVVHVEVEDDDISVIVYTRVTTKFWSKSRLRQIWEILRDGYSDTEAALIMTEQQALNYSETLKSAIEDLKAQRNATDN